MNYTNGPRSLIYRDKRNLDDFIEANELNATLIKNMAEIEELLNSDFEQHALICMNAAYYICTIFMLEKHPIWRLSGIDSFICKLNMHPVEEYKKIIFSLVYLMLKHYNKNWQDNNKDLLKGIYVCIYPEYKNARVIMDVSIEGHPSDIKQTLEAKLPPNFVLPDDEFAPRIIDKEAVNDALSEKGFSWVKFVNYFEERSVRDVVKAYGSTEEEKHNVVDLLRQVSQGFYTAGFNDYPEKVDKMLNDIDKEIFLEFNPNAEQEITGEEKSEMTTPIDLAKYEAQIKELKKEVERLTSDNKKQKKQQTSTADHDEIDELKEEIEYLKTETGKLTSKEAAILTITACYHAGGLPPNRENLYPILTNLFGVGEALAKRRLREGINEKGAEALAKCFDEVSPMIARTLREMPEMLKNKKKK